MKDGIGREEGSRLSGTASGTIQRMESPDVATPPPDHAEFVEVRNSGLRTVRENLTRRKKVPRS
jgi:hypothetical protein